ncbi:polypyrimidine tract-binding protein homolog 1 isoform X1 [Olea europaea var. sylvestris]|uniref:polypyrimidine tract-binding protein homolog 1 isoform X1 n=1 Tax=Olea europaea var. sylvestris TaxID=158386 RepID=UPI000C1D76EE|nr:polypyrimidine tract-binding protein homolog 1 isoform X1 [Olea europaea var. sylvestris]
MSTSGQQQFRYTQTPSKVLHLRNLPWECTEEELVELCKPFGKIVNTKCNVGANRNQAFVEFVDLNQAINMVTYYASSSEPANVRGKTVYIQYSNRHEIVNNKSPGDVPGNVLLVTIEGVEAGDVSIDVIHLVFSAFGFVHKIATFEKAAGFQALIQYSDVQTAATARESLDGRSIPRYLLPGHVNECHLRISYSAHTDLNIKFQSHRSRDYTNPYLPVNPTAMEGIVQPIVGPDGIKKEFESNVLLASIENMQYAVTVDVLHSVFSAFGTVQKIAIFEKNGGTQALIQYPDITTAAVAKDALEGHCIYDGGYCKLHLSYSRHTDLNVKAYSDKSRDYTVPESLAMHQAPGVPAPTSGWLHSTAASVGPGIGYASGGALPVQSPLAPVSWDTASQTGRPTFMSGPSTFPGQTYASTSVPAYSSAAIPPGSSPLPQTNHITSGAPPMRVTQPMHQSNVLPGGISPPGQPPYYAP